MALIVAVLCPLTSPPRAEVSLQSVEEVYIENFNSLPSTGSSFIWTDDLTLPGWHAANTGSQSFNPASVSVGSSTTGDLYSFGSSGSTDRALGSVGSGSTSAGSFYWGVELVNETTHTITAVTISYTGEQWRNSAAAAQSISFQYSFNAQDVRTGTYITIPQLEFVSPITGGTAGARDGNSESLPDEHS